MVSHAREPFRCTPWKMAPSTGPIAFFTASFGKDSIYKFHHVPSEIWKQRVPSNRAARTKRERKGGLPTPARRNDFPRCAIGVH
jgi:hypothetical protein